MIEIANWRTFEEQYNFEESVYNYVRKSLELISQSTLKEEVFCSFAFNCSAYNGYVLLSLDTDMLNRERKYYPPDWTYEVVEDYVLELRDLGTLLYEPIEDAYHSIVKDLEDQAQFDDFTNGFLTSLRKVMVRIERENMLSQYLRTTSNLWTLVTEIDADEDEEERLLQEERSRAIEV
ncbi:DUF4303 domain-containing protein [Myroides odoratimimus]|uniref:DUF4303 domain-containing protein n=1 Tax=Myroides odoratimimus TaxID=76832 RepID=UPI0025788180|nr:DUF4303 domain-containing protein [Myroides odoratimimus]MDM1498039.1 DUF4303 domain-containing protein [Myroides odoratimimus]